MFSYLTVLKTIIKIEQVQGRKLHYQRGKTHLFRVLSRKSSNTRGGGNYRNGNV